MTLRYSHLSPAHKLAAVQRLARPATGTETTAKKPPAEAPSQISTAPADSRAGDRGRTGDVELGKLIADQNRAAPTRTRAFTILSPSTTCGKPHHLGYTLWKSPVPTVPYTRLTHGLTQRHL